ncbi:MAG: hypothetical protein ACRCST_04680 [Turicibacter sp.]
MEQIKEVDKLGPVVKIEEWILFIVLCTVPLVNLAMLIYWSLNKRTNINKRNFARAVILYFIIIIVLAIVAMVLM